MDRLSIVMFVVIGAVAGTRLYDFSYRTRQARRRTIRHTGPDRLTACLKEASGAR